MIRKAKKSDVSKIIRLCGQRAKMRSVYPKLPKKRFYTRTSKGYTAKEYKIIVYEDNNVIKGFSKFFIFVGRNDMERNKMCVIERLAADEEYESCRIRTQLLEWIKKYAEKCNCNSIDLRVCYENYDAVNLYSSFGFIPTAYELKQKNQRKDVINRIYKTMICCLHGFQARFY